MATDDCTLRAIVEPMDGGFQARLLDLNIAVSAKSEDGLLAEIQHALIATYEIALDLGETPFVNLLQERRPDGRWRNNRSRIGFIELPLEVAQALALLFLHPRPVQHIAVVKKAA